MRKSKKSPGQTPRSIKIMHGTSLGKRIACGEAKAQYQSAEPSIGCHRSDAHCCVGKDCLRQEQIQSHFRIHYRRYVSCVPNSVVISFLILHIIHRKICYFLRPQSPSTLTLCFRTSTFRCLLTMYPSSFRNFARSFIYAIFKNQEHDYANDPYTLLDNTTDSKTSLKQKPLQVITVIDYALLLYMPFL